MNFLLLKQISIISVIAGALLGLITTIPYISLISFLVAFLFLSAFIIVYMKQNDLIGVINIREGCIYGAIIGFVSFIAFFAVFGPISIVIGWAFRSYTLGFLGLFLTGFGTTIVMLILAVFMACISALMNGFTGLVTAYVYELVTGIKKENDENTSIDFEIK